MNATKTGVAANLIGIIALVLGTFGIDLDDESQKVLIGAAGIVGLIINQVLIAWAQRQQPAKPDNKLIPDVAKPINSENGFFTPNFAGVLLILATLGAFGMTLAGCQTVPETPRQILLSAYSATEFAATAIKSAKEEGRITAEQRDVYINDVQRARDLLHDARLLLANEPAPGSTNDADATAKLRFAQEILISIQAALAKEQNP